MRRCEYCLCPVDASTELFSVDHIVPVAHGGATELDNLAWACRGCNTFKKDKAVGIDPLNRATAPLYNPRQHIWSEHFAWNGNLTKLNGLTATGRATVETLQMNRDSVVTLRRALLFIRMHPATNATSVHLDDADDARGLETE
jgi:hypothetical protein